MASLNHTFFWRQILQVRQLSFLDDGFRWFPILRGSGDASAESMVADFLRLFAGGSRGDTSLDIVRALGSIAE
jgi:hypothetical protein